MSIAAFDDYGLDEVRVLMRDRVGGEVRSRSLWTAGDKPLRNLSLDALLTESASLKMGGSLRYLIEAHDTKGQTARTQEFVVRIAADANAADQQLSKFDRDEDSFQDKLVKLMADQKKVKSALEKLEKEYAPLSEKLIAGKDDVKPNDQTKPGEKATEAGGEKPLEADAGGAEAPGRTTEGAGEAGRG